jgi:NADPH:quinone reductase-like Zn-dependent oxidoreductase
MFGYADGQPTPFPFVEAVGRNLSIRGYKTQGLMGDQEAMEKAKAYILAGLRSEAFKLMIDRTFELEEIGQAYRRMTSNHQIGKIDVTV